MSCESYKRRHSYSGIGSWYRQPIDGYEYWPPILISENPFVERVCWDKHMSQSSLRVRENADRSNFPQNKCNFSSTTQHCTGRIIKYVFVQNSWTGQSYRPLTTVRLCSFPPT
ncbi:hypothetical protein NQD34_005275 [Periophthalmus magnuspinnatus]|nr:hypothetical protein NQD34_005275 [Periophthalmus magnuspinnatus]